MTRDDTPNRGGDGSVDGPAADRRTFLGGTAALGLFGLTSMDAAGASEGQGDAPPYAPDEHDHSGENGARDRLGVAAPVKSIRANHLRARERPRVDVDAFGAVGDGATDDTAAIQRAADSPEAGDGAVLSFSGGKTYYVTDTIEVDAAKIRGIEGSNATLTTDVDTTVLRYAGHFSSTAGPPVGDNEDIIDDEFVSYVRDLQVYHRGPYDFEDSPYEGVGIELDSTFGLTVSGCHVYRMGTGIRVTGRHRNMILRGNHVYDNLPWGIHFQGVNLHQVNVLGNHLSYAAAPIYVEDSALYNLQLVGNDVEVSDGSARCIVVEGGSLVESQFDGNTIQGHGCDRVFDVSPDRARYLLVSNNHVSNCRNDAVRFDAGDGRCRHVSVTDNTFKSVGGHAVTVTADAVPHLQVAGNDVDAGRCLCVDASGDVGPIRVAGNTVAPDGRGGDAISISAGGALSNAGITDNASSLTYDGVDVNSWFVNLDADGDAEAVTVTGNRLRGRGSGNHGLRLAASDAAGVIAKNNVVAGLAESATAYALPATAPGTVVARDNLDVRRQPPREGGDPAFVIPERSLTIDGDVGELAGVRHLDVEADFEPYDDTPTVTGDVWVTWDDDNLYLAADLADDDHVGRYDGYLNYRDDAIMLGVSPGAPDWSHGASEITVALGPEGPTVYRIFRGGYSGGGSLDEETTAEIVRTDDGHTVYEIAIPWDVLHADAGDRYLGLAIGVLDQDDGGDTASGWTEWGGGLFGGKNVAEYNLVALDGR